MALDYELLKKELEEAQKQRISDFWVPEMGENLVRILPPRNGKLFYRRVGVHYRLAESGMEFCPRVTFDESCPVCETVSDLKKLGSTGAMELVRRFAVTERYLMNLIVLSSGERTIKQYLAPKTVRLELLKIILDPDYGDITDLSTGRNVIIEKIQGSGGFVNYIVRAKPNQIPLSSILGKKISVDDVPDFEEILEERAKSYEELRYVLFGGEEVGVEDLIGKYSISDTTVDKRDSGKGKVMEEVISEAGNEGVGKWESKKSAETDIDELLKKAMDVVKSMRG